LFSRRLDKRNILFLQDRVDDQNTVEVLRFEFETNIRY